MGPVETVDAVVNLPIIVQDERAHNTHLVFGQMR